MPTELTPEEAVWALQGSPIGTNPTSSWKVANPAEMWNTAKTIGSGLGHLGSEAGKRAGAFGLGFGDSATMGWGDELAGAMARGGLYTDPMPDYVQNMGPDQRREVGDKLYTGTRDQVRDFRKETFDKYPGYLGLGELTGTLALPGGAAKKGVSFLENVARGSKIGMATGAINEVGNLKGDEDLSHQIGVPIIASLLGAGFGAIGGGIGHKLIGGRIADESIPTWKVDTSKGLEPKKMPSYWGKEWAPIYGRQIEEEGGRDLVKAQIPPAAKKLGYDTLTFHAPRTIWKDNNLNLDSTKLSEDGLFSTPHPELASLYADPRHWEAESPNIMPLLLKSKNYHVFDAKNRTYEYANSRAIDEALKRKKPGVRIDNVYDEPTGTGTLKGPKTIFVTFPEDNIRSLFAKFDPANASLKHLMASGAAVSVPSAALQNSQENLDTLKALQQ